MDVIATPFVLGIVFALAEWEVMFPLISGRATTVPGGLVEKGSLQTPSVLLYWLGPQAKNCGQFQVTR